MATLTDAVEPEVATMAMGLLHQSHEWKFGCFTCWGPVFSQGVEQELDIQVALLQRACSAWPFTFELTL